MNDPRREVPRTDAVLADPRLAGELDALGREAVKSAIRAAQEQVRIGLLAPESVVEAVLNAGASARSGLAPVLNATGVVVHTNLGRAPLSAPARAAIAAASGYVDVELDLATGKRAPRGRGMLAALLARIPAAEAALVVNNGAAALVLATTALAAGREVIVSRGELVEIGDGFRLPDLIASTGARLREVGTTNRTHLRDYVEALGPGTGCILKVHPSNFKVSGFTSSVPVDQLSTLGVPLVHDLGSGLLGPDEALPDEPDAHTALTAGAHLVTASGDKLLGGPQAGLILGRADLIERLRRHPLARALRLDKLTIAALHATLTAGDPPVQRYLHATPESLRHRTLALAERLGIGLAQVIEVDGRIGGGGAPGVPLPGWALSLPEGAAQLLRAARVLARQERGRTLVDLRCVDEQDEDALALVLAEVLATLPPALPATPSTAPSPEVSSR